MCCNGLLRKKFVWDSSDTHHEETGVFEVIFYTRYIFLLLFLIFAFACNAKRFAIVIIFFIFLNLSAVYGQTVKSFLANVLRLVSLEACDQDLTYSLDTSKIFP